jgi:hypothetical protein
MPIFLAANVAGQRGLIIGDLALGAGRILGIDRGHGPQHDRRVAHGLGHRPGLIQRAGKGDDAPAADAAIGRLQPDRAGEGRRLADRAAGIGAGRRQTQIGRHRRRRAARGAARRQLPAVHLPRVHDRAVTGGFIRRAHGEFIHAELAQHDRARVPQVLGHGRFILRQKAVKDAAGRLRGHIFGAEQILDAQGNAAHGGRVAGLDALHPPPPPWSRADPGVRWL